MPIFSLTYLSTATRALTTQQLCELLIECRERNRTLGLTGMLLYTGGNFIQVIEGDKAVVEAAFARIEADPRHHNLVVVLTDTHAAPEFRCWSMSFPAAGVASESMPAAYSDFLKAPLENVAFRHNPTSAQQFLLVFKQHMR